ncbi:putative membrane protein [Helicobacter pylori Hp H-9]|nr:putative membrane protein [Helicobacter pylori Hp H-9]
MGFDLFLFANPHCFRFLIFEFLFFGGGFDGKILFSVFSQ